MSPEHQQPTPLTMEAVTRFAKEAALKYNGHIPTLILEGSRRPFVTQFPDLPPIREQQTQLMYSVGYTLGQEGQLGLLRQIFLITEGWLSLGDEDHPLIIPPSQDPERKKALVITHLDVRTRHMEAATFEMVRNEDHLLIEMRDLALPDDGTEVRSPLIEAIAAGYQAATRTRFN